MLTVQPHGEEYAVVKDGKILALFGSLAEAERNVDMLKTPKPERVN